MSTFPSSAATDPNLPHDSMVSHVIGRGSALCLLVTVTVGARFWIRWRFVKGRSGADDWCILVAWILAVAFDVGVITQTRFGLGRHIYDIPPNTDFNMSLKLYYSGEIIYYICVAVTKVAVLNLYLRIAVQRAFRRLVWACIAIVTATAVASVTASIFQCTPVRKALDTSISGSCINVNALFFANAGLDIFQDAFIYILPVRMLYQLQVPRRQKIALMLVFAVGGFVVITGMVRLNYLKAAQNTPDPTYNNYPAGVWSMIECTVGVVCASLPTFKPLIDHCFPGLIAGRNGDPSKVSAPEASAHLSRGYMRKTSPSQIELEEGLGWKDFYTTDHGAANNQSYSVTANGGPLNEHGSQEHLRGGEAQGGNGGIWKTTSVVIDRGGL